MESSAEFNSCLISSLISLHVLLASLVLSFFLSPSHHVDKEVIYSLIPFSFEQNIAWKVQGDIIELTIYA